MSWTHERDELLKKLAADGLTSKQIASELGGITKNSVIGRARRKGVSLSKDRREYQIETNEIPIAKRVKAPPVAKRIKAILAPVFKPTRPVLVAEITAEDVQKATDIILCSSCIKFLDLNYGMCRWPEGQGMFCGTGTVTGRPYCALHCKISYRTPHAGNR